MVPHVGFQVDAGLDGWCDLANICHETTISSGVHGGTVEVALDALVGVGCVGAVQLIDAISTLVSHMTLALKLTLAQVFTQVHANSIRGRSASWCPLMTCRFGQDRILDTYLSHNSHLVSHVWISLLSILAHSLFVSQWIIQISNLWSVIAIMGLRVMHKFFIMHLVASRAHD